MPDALALIANVAGKLTREGLRATGRGATALPGLVALTLDPDFIGAVPGLGIVLPNTMTAKATVVVSQ